MSSTVDALQLITARMDRIEDRWASETEEIGELREVVAVLTKENELTRKSLDRFTNALIVGSISIVTAAIAVILYGPGA